MSLDHEDAILGCLLGGGIGDACGSSFENGPPSGDSILDRPWTLTDDTALTLASCEAIARSGSTAPEHLAAELVRWHREGRIPRAGAATTKALQELAAGGHWALVGRRGEHAASNGAAMRAAPLAFCLDPDAPADRQRLRDLCRITHHHDEAYCGALAVVLGLRRLLDSARLDRGWLTVVADALPDTRVRDQLLALAALVARAHGASGHAAESVPLACFAAAALAERPFAALLQELVGVGGDADTNASLFGQLAGTLLGRSGLPGELALRLPSRESIEAIGVRFAVAIRRSGRAPERTS